MPTKLSALPAASSVGTADVMLVDQSATSKQATVAQVAAAMLASPALTGTPTAPTATVGTNTTQVATTAFVLANAPSAPVASVYGRTGAIVATTGDYAVAQVTGAAPLASPTFTGTPAAPTATTATNTTQLATTAFVQANITALALGTASTHPATDFATSLTATAVKTGAYNAVAGDLIPVDTTSGSVSITLPTAPADRTRIAAKMVIQGGTNTVSIACGGSDVFNKPGGATTATLTLLSQAIGLQYAASGAIWYVVADDLPLTQLDARYPTIAHNLSDLASASTARTNLGVGAAHRSFGVYGTPTLNATTPPIFLNRAYTCNGVEAGCDTTPSGSSATLTLQTSTDGATWSTLVAVSIAAAAYTGTAAVTSAISPGTLVRGKFTAVNAVADMTATLYLVG